MGMSQKHISTLLVATDQICRFRCYPDLHVLAVGIHKHNLCWAVRFACPQKIFVVQNGLPSFVRDGLDYVYYSKWAITRENGSVEHRWL